MTNPLLDMEMIEAIAKVAARNAVTVLGATVLVKSTDGKHYQLRYAAARIPVTEPDLVTDDVREPDTEIGVGGPAQ